MIRSIIYKGGKKKKWHGLVKQRNYQVMNTTLAALQLHLHPGKGIPKEIIAILSSKRGLHKLYKY